MSHAPSCQYCKSRAYFRFPDDSKPRMCQKHRVDGMITTSKSICHFEGCFKRSTYGGASNKKTYCKTHRQQNMIRFEGLCKEPGCCKSAVFGTSRSTHCYKHKQNGMKSRFSLCELAKCGTQASCNYPGQKSRRFCVKHKLEGMVALKKRICSECTSASSYGYPGRFATRCAKHTLPGFIRNPNRICNQCPKPALYGINGIPEWCESHKSQLHINLVQQLCTVCGVLEIVDQEAKCSNCSLYLTLSLHLRKQKLIKSWLDMDETLKTYESYDKAIGSCSQQRPDFVWDCLEHKVILEVDEYQHRDRNPECEMTRMKNITYALGMPVLWIRFNPDSRTPREHVKRQVLLDILRRALLDSPKNADEFCRCIYLYYDKNVTSTQNICLT